MIFYCQNCGKDTAGAGVTFYGNVLCGEACKKQLSERLYFRDTPPEAGSTWFCPHCGAENPMGDPRKQLRPSCTSCGKPLDPASAAPPKKGGCLGLLLGLLVPAGLLGAALLAACSASVAPAVTNPDAAARRAAAGSRPEPPGLGPEANPERVARQGGKRAVEAVISERFAHRRRRLAQREAAAAPGSSGEVVLGPVIALGPVDPQPSVGDFLHGAKFEPPLGRVLHGTGQWLEGNLDYLAALDDSALEPAATLIFLSVGDWPRGWDMRINSVRAFLDELSDDGLIPHINIHLVGNDAANQEYGIEHEILTSDRYDGRLRDLAHSVRAVVGPVFVRIGGEFSGAWNPYTPFEYPAAFRRIVELFRAEGVVNAAFVWCYEPDSPGDFADRDAEGNWRWYPGDDVVDWFGLDVFEAEDFSGPLERDGVLLTAGKSEQFLRMALEHGKPVILAETSPAFVQITSDPADGEADWEAWFAPFFEFLDANSNIQAFHFINVDWSTTGEYEEAGWRDARIGVNALITERYRAELAKPRYLHAGNTALLNGASELPPPIPAPTPTPEAQPGRPGR